MATRFTAIQLGCAVLWAAGLMDTTSQQILTRARDGVDWPAQLASRLDDAMLASIDPEEIEFNPYLSLDQVLLLYFCAWLATGSSAVAAPWAQRYGIRPAQLTWLEQQFRAARFRSTPTHPATTFLEPPDTILAFIQKQVWRLSLGVEELTPIAHVRPHFYQHPWDRAALRQMQSITGFETILRKFSEWHFEKIQLVLSQSTRIEVSERQFPELFELWLICCERAGFQENRPDLYVELGALNAFTSGTERPQVVVSSALLSLMSPREVMFVLGHELGHILSEHVLYTMFAMGFTRLTELLGQATLGIGALVGQGLGLAVFDWQRKAELTCDRFGLLCCQDLQAAMNVLIKLAGAPPAYFDKINWEAFADQGRDYEQDADVHNKVYRWFLTAYQNHPWPAVRAHELRRWVQEGQFQRLAGCNPRGFTPKHASALPPAPQPTGSPATPEHPAAPARPATQEVASAGNCVRCEAPLQSGDQFCADCGMRVPEPDSSTPLFCLGCGFEGLHEGDQFCPECGNPL